MAALLVRRSGTIMKKSWPFIILVLLLCQYYVDAIHKKLEYKHSFKGPNLAQRDGTIAFWEISGDAIASNEQLRLAPSIRSKQGMAWNVKPMIEADFWEIEFAIKISGQGRVGADGLAIWYTAAKGTPGNVFGSSDNWVGLGVFFDSFDNDAQRNNPAVVVMLNDGTKQYDHASDGINQKVGGCQIDFRNKPFPVRGRMEYNANVLSLFLSDGMTTDNVRYDHCFRIENVFLPKAGYFGLSAATGGLADDHDVLSFLVSSINPIVVQPPAAPPTISDAEKKRLDDEFQRQQQQFEAEREKFMKEHPDKAAKHDDIAKMYEDATSRELRLIYEGQSSLHTAIINMDAKIVQVIQQQQQQMALISQLTQRSGAVPQQPGMGVGDAQSTNEILTLVKESSANIRDAKSYVIDIHSKANNIEQQVQQQANLARAQPAGTDQYTLQAVKTHMEGIKHDIEQLRLAAANRPHCPTVDLSCLSNSVFLMAIFLQTVLLIIYWMLRGGQEKAKFY